MSTPSDQANCDHHFGKYGEQQNCTKCGLDRAMAERMGRAVNKRKIRERKQQL